MIIVPLLGFVILYLCAKALEKNVPFYIAALICTGLLVALETAFRSGGMIPMPFLIGPAVKLVAALITFYYLDRYEETIANWLVTFGLGYVVLVILL